METTLEKESTIETLKAEVNQLKRDLNRCLENESRILQKANRHQWTLANMINGLFQPSREGNEILHKYSTWWPLQCLLLERREFEDMWTSHDFRKMVIELNALVEGLNEAQLSYSDEPQCGLNDVAHRVANCSESEHRGWVMLKDAIQDLYSIKDSERMSLSIDEVDELYICLRIIVEVQKLHLSQKD